MQKNEQDNDVRLAATTALFNALEFAHSNFNNDSERNYLMQASGQLHYLSHLLVVNASAIKTMLWAPVHCFKTSTSTCAFVGDLRRDKQPRCAGSRGVFRVLRQNRQQLL